MDHLSPDTILSPRNLDSVTYSRLISLLSESDNWRKVADTFGIFSDHDFQNSNWSRKPAETLVFELGARLCTVELLCEILQECQMHKVLMLFKNCEKVKIVEQPCNGNGSKMIIRGTPLILSCKATGLPLPSYQWYCDNHELKGHKDSILCINNFGLENEGGYYCIVSQEGCESLSSNYVTVSLAPEAPVIIKQPLTSVICKLGMRVVLNVIAKGYPELQYQWYKGNEELKGSTEPKLCIAVEDKRQEGAYRCYVYNSAGEVWTNECSVTICSTSRPEPSAKIALLIANQLYDNLSCLNTPENDVKILTDILQDLGFSTIALQNLTLSEMRSSINYFTEIVPKDAYIVFYFSGHGFEICDKFMLPVDAPGPEDYLQTHALSERELLQTLLSSQPKLLLELLDMCLKPPDPLNRKIFDEKTSLYKYEASNNLIQGYATTSYFGAYEKKSYENGLYVDFLKEYLTKNEDMPIVEILRNVAKDIAKACPLQKPFFGTNVTVEYRLTDPCRDSSQLREKIEALSNIPKDFVLSFNQVSVKSKISCSPFLGIFLNTLEVRVSNLHEYKVSCETLGEELLFELSRINGDAVIKVMNIQRLTASKMLTLCLSGKNGQLMDYAMWDIGKPLIASSDLWWKMQMKFQET